MNPKFHTCRSRKFDYTPIWERSLEWCPLPKIYLYLVHCYHRINSGERHLKTRIIGRQKEKRQLRDIADSTSARFVGVWGRRRVGKTYLIDTYFENIPSLKVVGKHKANKNEQLNLFRVALQKSFFDGASLPEFKSWAHCFEMLAACIKKHKKGHFIVFLDEVPWLAGKSTNEFLGALDHSWNTELCQIPYLRLIVCGSAASWMIKNFSKAKGGLHNRLTDSIHLFPFSLHETEEFFNARGFSYSRKTVLESYLCFGGVPYYLNLMRPSESPVQAVSRLCFQNGQLVNEFETLFEALFENGKVHKQWIQLLAQKNCGLTRIELRQKLNVGAGGFATKILEELEAAGFISRLSSFVKVSEIQFRVTDPFVLFHLRWMQKSPGMLLSSQNLDGYWQKEFDSPEALAWKGYAFENVCFVHANQILNALGVGQLRTKIGTWRSKSLRTQSGSKNLQKTQGAQIDLLIERSDGCITICEIKNYGKPLKVTSKLVHEIQTKKTIFQEENETKKTILCALVSASEIEVNDLLKSNFQNTVHLDDLFLL